MNTLPAQEIKRRGISAVDELLAQGDVHIIRNNQAQYVVLSEARYQELLLAEEDASGARVRAALEELKQGKGKRYKSASDILKALDKLGDE
jgi:PHD/YefM family antitoxin component YafN of YafNO toxin-antitoxin module